MIFPGYVVRTTTFFPWHRYSYDLSPRWNNIQKLIFTLYVDIFQRYHLERLQGFRIPPFRQTGWQGEQPMFEYRRGDQNFERFAVTAKR